MLHVWQAGQELTHAPLLKQNPAAQLVATHCPCAHACPVELGTVVLLQVNPQVPQLLVSVWVFIQVPEQHTPVEQVVPLGALHPFTGSQVLLLQGSVVGGQMTVW